MLCADLECRGGKLDSELTVPYVLYHKRKSFLNICIFGICGEIYNKLLSGYGLGFFPNVPYILFLVLAGTLVVKVTDKCTTSTCTTSTSTTLVQVTMAVFPILGVPKMALRVPKSKF